MNIVADAVISAVCNHKPAVRQRGDRRHKLGIRCSLIDAEIAAVRNRRRGRQREALAGALAEADGGDVQPGRFGAVHITPVAAGRQVAFQRSDSILGNRAGGVRQHHRRVVAAGDGESQRRGGGYAAAIDHRVGEGLRRRLPVGQRLGRGPAVGQRVGIAAVGGDADVAIGAGDGGGDTAAGRWHRSGADADDRLRIAIIDVGIFGQDIARRRGIARAGKARLHQRRAGIGVPNRRGHVIGAGDGDGEGRRTAHARRVAAMISEDLGNGLPRLKLLRVRIAIVQRIGIGAVRRDRQRSIFAFERLTHRAGDRTERDGVDRLGVRDIDVGVIGKDIASEGRGSGNQSGRNLPRFGDRARIRHDHQPVIRAGDVDRDGPRISAAMAVAQRQRIGEGQGLAGLKILEIGGCVGEGPGDRAGGVRRRGGHRRPQQRLQLVGRCRQAGRIAGRSDGDAGNAVGVEHIDIGEGQGAGQGRDRVLGQAVGGGLAAGECRVIIRAGDGDGDIGRFFVAVIVDDRDTEDLRDRLADGEILDCGVIDREFPVHLAILIRGAGRVIEDVDRESPEIRPGAADPLCQRDMEMAGAARCIGELDLADRLQLSERNRDLFGNAAGQIAVAQIDVQPAVHDNPPMRNTMQPAHVMCRNDLLTDATGLLIQILL